MKLQIVCIVVCNQWKYRSVCVGMCDQSDWPGMSWDVWLPDLSFLWLSFVSMWTHSAALLRRMLKNYRVRLRQVQQLDLLPVCVPSHYMPTNGPMSITFARVQQSVFTWTQMKVKEKTDQEVRHPKAPRNPTWNESDWSHLPPHTDLYFHSLHTTIHTICNFIGHQA